MNSISIRGKFFRLLTRAVLWSAGIAATGLACGWLGGAGERSVRFNWYAKSGRDFALLPPLSKSFVIETPRVNRIGDYGDIWDRAKQLLDEIGKLWDDALEAEERGDLNAARNLLSKYLERTEPPRQTLRVNGDLYSHYEPLDIKDRRERRNSAQDQLDAMGNLVRGARPAAVSQYLQARGAYDSDAPDEEVTKTLDAIRDPSLRDNVAYLRAALPYRADKFEEAADAFTALAHTYPGSEKREAALLMAALATMKQSEVYDAPYVRNRDDRGQPHTAKDDAWYAARTGFQRLMREYPRGRYFNDARGWLAYLSYRAGDWPDAMVDYYRMLGDAGDASARLEATFSLYIVRSEVTDSEMREVEARLEREPAAALAYCYHEMYNFATGYCEYPYDYPEDRSEFRVRSTESRRRIAAFANRLAARASVNAAFVLRAAMANLEVEDYAAASRLARRALQLGSTGEQRARALWVEGVADHLRGEYRLARDAMKRLIAEKPAVDLRERAERYLPIILEDMGDIEGALDQYLALNYHVDAAYFIDVLMTPEQLAHFIEGHPMSPKRDELLYALGVRYLRDKRWNEARATLAKARTTARGVDDDYNDEHSHLYPMYGSEPETLKEDPADPAVPGVRPQWVEQDLRTANDLERLARDVDQAEGHEAKAEALYQLASYQYQGNLLFYNSAAWRWERHDHLYDLNNSGLFRQPGEAQLLFRNMQSHDAAARSLEDFLEVVRRFPNTRAARDALYTAAVCHERLSEYNNYWRDIYSRGGYAGSRLVTYKDVRAAYPDYQLPRGTFGWQPATRTVNGGPGWKPPPKPIPRTPRWKRYTSVLVVTLLDMRQRLNTAALEIAKLCVYLSWLQFQCFIIGMAGYAWYLCFKAKRRLMAEMCEYGGWPRALIGPAPQELSPRMPIQSYRDFLRHEARDEWIRNARRWLQNTTCLLLHTRAGPVLVTNFMLYGSALVFLVMLLSVIV
ncbi:MAG TPA: hypothetical protein VJH03_18410 [Blastocatellia bacterium]|nr:hypothetical protein [Blastocatellia bacterium]